MVYTFLGHVNLISERGFWCWRHWDETDIFRQSSKSLIGDTDNVSSLLLHPLVFAPVKPPKSFEGNVGFFIFAVYRIQCQGS